MAIVAINRVEKDFVERDDWLGDDVHRRRHDRADRDCGL
jgi:hypothetical protein